MNISATAVAVAAVSAAALTLAGGCSAPTGLVRLASAPMVTVDRVVDGDTFDADGQRVGVLVIDSCELSTPAGESAKTDAVHLLQGRQVTLTGEPGADRDRYGRILRYVTLPDGRDYGDIMVARPHTGVYEGRSDASPARLDRARRLDDGRTCTPGEDR